MRTAVGDLLLGANTYDLYVAQLELRNAKKVLEDRQARLTSLLAAIPGQYGSMNAVELAGRITALEQERDRVIEQIAAVDDAVPADVDKEFEDRRSRALRDIRRARSEVRQLEESVEKLELEISDLDTFVDYLEQTMEKVNASSSIAGVLGSIDFAYCPACLEPLEGHTGTSQCVLCSKPVDPEREGARYLAWIIHRPDLPGSCW